MVVGAGLAGLLCATTLESRGYSVQVLEASDGVGGRVRTDVVDGYRCDRGFQLLNPAYPAIKRFIDVGALDLQAFGAGVAVAGQHPRGPGIRILGDPRRAPQLLLKTLSSGYLNPIELARLARWAAPALGSVSKLLAAADSGLAESLDRGKVTGRLRHEILQPFLTGVLAESDGSTSANFTRLLLRSFLLGTPGVPAQGMVALPAQLAARLITPVLLGVRVDEVRPGISGPKVRTEDGEFCAAAVVVAADPSSAAQLVPLAAPMMKGLRTYWFSMSTAPTASNLLHVDGRGPSSGPVVNTAVMSNAAPSYAPAGRHLVQATCLLSQDTEGSATAAEPAVREHLARIYGASTTDWDLLIRHDIQAALPQQLPPLAARRSVDLGSELFVAGDHRDTGSLQGALVSGRRAANAVSSVLRAGR